MLQFHTVKQWQDYLVLPFPPKIQEVFFDQIQDSINPDPSTVALLTQESKARETKFLSASSLTNKVKEANLKISHPF